MYGIKISGENGQQTGALVVNLFTLRRTRLVGASMSITAQHRTPSLVLVTGPKVRKGDATSLSARRLASKKAVCWAAASGDGMSERM